MECFAFCCKNINIEKIKLQQCNLIFFLFKDLILGQTMVMYFNYHAKAQNLIKSGHCLNFEIVEEYNGIKPCLLLFFDCEKPMPIREAKFEEYLFLLVKFGVDEKNKQNI